MSSNVSYASIANAAAYTATTTADWPGSDPGTLGAGLDRLATRTNGEQFIYAKVGADAAASTVTAETVFARMPRAGTITAVVFYPSAALTGHDTNNATLLVDQRDGAGGAAANVASLTTTVASGNWTAYVGKSLGSLTNTALAAGALLTFEITKASSGVTVPSGILVVVVEPASGA